MGKLTKGLTKNNNIFTFHRLVELFLIGSVVGFLIEGVWAYVRVGHWENHAATVWGPFCPIYGVGAVVVFILSTYLEDKNIVVRFVVYSIAGTMVEYFGSLFQEVFFNSISWNYKSQFLNIDGRVSLMMAMIWGLLGLLFIGYIYKPLRLLFEKVEEKHVNGIVVILSLFMALNLVITALAINRWQDRINNKPPSNTIDRYIDHQFNDQYMEEVFHNLKFITSKK